MKKLKSTVFRQKKKASKGKFLNENKRPCNSPESERVSHKGMLVFARCKKTLSPNIIVKVMFSARERNRI